MIAAINNPLSNARSNGLPSRYASGDSRIGSPAIHCEAIREALGAPQAPRQAVEAG